MQIVKIITVLATVLLAIACAHVQFSYDCPRTYEHSCDFYYQGKRIEECSKDPEGRLCQELKATIKARQKADAEGRCYRNEVCIP